MNRVEACDKGQYKENTYLQPGSILTDVDDEGGFYVIGTFQMITEGFRRNPSTTYYVPISLTDGNYYCYPVENINDLLTITDLKPVSDGATVTVGVGKHTYPMLNNTVEERLQSHTTALLAINDTIAGIQTRLDNQADLNLAKSSSSFKKIDELEGRIDITDIKVNTATNEIERHDERLISHYGFHVRLTNKIKKAEKRLDNLEGQNA